VRWLVLLLLLVAPASALWRSGAPAVFAVCATVNAATFLAYRLDKRRAETRGRRLPEAWLHFLEFAGGWPAAFLAQRILRHKNSRTGYQVVFWFIVLVHETVAVDLLLGWPVVRGLGGWLR
jgi:uncharacterized membrane protein YsdA (DUF1294 family)